MTGIRTIILLTGILASGVGQATDVNVNGRVISSPCILDSSSANTVVDFKRLDKFANFKSAGDATAWIDFSLKMTGCPKTTKQSTVTFDGEPDVTNPDYYKNSGTAAGVAIHMTGSDHSTLYANGSSMQRNVAADDSVEFPLAARVIATKPQGDITEGTINTVVQFSFTYQ